MLMCVDSSSYSRVNEILIVELHKEDVVSQAYRQTQKEPLILAINFGVFIYHVQVVGLVLFVMKVSGHDQEQ